ncbi:hypothetical protein [Nocardia brasiliensis]|uniref:hypothetical protein n=1 Tax=Nocardia brasiliensis TaxID=37326 RepID=UPI002455A6AF|nr:hypothetical protein [Nocardia brasiliensis]
MKRPTTGSFHHAGADDRALGASLSAGTAVLSALDRLGRSLEDLISIVAGLRKRGIGFPVSA